MNFLTAFGLPDFLATVLKQSARNSAVAPGSSATNFLYEAVLIGEGAGLTPSAVAG